MKLLPYGDHALFVDLEIPDGEDRMPRTHRIARALRERFPGSDVVVGTGCLTLSGLDSTRSEVESVVRDLLDDASRIGTEPRVHVVRAIYDGPDLDEVSERTGLSRDAIVELHAGREYLVEIVGFLPGFAYLGPVDSRLVLPRRPTPRPRVPQNAVGIAGAQTGIYPFSCPGGWNLIARAIDFLAFDPRREPPLAFVPGDRVRFEPC